ncbi:hypothetical protein [Amycolatopsis sp. NPDC003731]
MERGELGGPPELSLVADLVEGPLMHRRMLGRQPRTPEYLDTLAAVAHGVLTGTAMAP